MGNTADQGLKKSQGGFSLVHFFGFFFVFETFQDSFPWCGRLKKLSLRATASGVCVSGNTSALAG